MLDPLTADRLRVRLRYVPDLAVVAAPVVAGALQQVMQRLVTDLREREFVSLIFGVIYGGGTWAFVVLTDMALSDRFAFPREHIYDSLGAAALVGSVAYLGTRTARTGSAILRIRTARTASADTKPSRLWPAVGLGGMMATVGLLTNDSASVPLGTQWVLNIVFPGVFGALMAGVQIFDRPPPAAPDHS